MMRRHLVHGAGLDLLVGRQVRLQQHLEPTLQVQTLLDLKIAVDLERPQLDVDAGAIGQVDIDGDEGQDDNDDQQNDVPSASHTFIWFLPDGLCLHFWDGCTTGAKRKRSDYTPTPGICQTHLTGL